VKRDITYENGQCVIDDPTPVPPPPCPESHPNCPVPPPIVPDPGDPVDPCSIDPIGPDCETPEEPVVLPLVVRIL
jgi:hypothetical protein